MDLSEHKEGCLGQFGEEEGKGQTTKLQSQKLNKTNKFNSKSGCSAEFLRDNSKSHRKTTSVKVKVQHNIKNLIQQSKKKRNNILNVSFNLVVYILTWLGWYSLRRTEHSYVPPKNYRKL